MLAALERYTGLDRRGQGPAFLVASGHGATHWLLGTFYVLLPFITKDLGLSYTQAGALVTLVHLSAFSANAGSGAIIDMGFRHIQVQVASLLIGAASLMAFGLTDRLLWLMPLVILLGATNNLWHPAAIAYLSARYPNNRGYALSIHTLGASFGDMLAPLAAGFLLASLSWQKTSAISALPVIFIAAILLLILGRGKAAARPPDAEHDLTAYFRKITGLISNRAVLGICTMAGFRSMTQNGLLVFIPLYLANVLQVSPVMLGLVLLGMQTGGMIAGPVAGILSDRLGRQPVVFAGLTATTFVVIALTLVSSATLFIGLVALLGFALFSVRPVIHSWTMDLAPEGTSGSAVSLLFASQSALSALVPLIGGLIADEWGLAAVFYVLAATMFIANILCYFLPKSR